MRTYATISADIVSSTSLSRQMIIKLTGEVKDFLQKESAMNAGFWGRVIRGDAIECVMDNPNGALRLAVMLKCLVKSFKSADGSGDAAFRQYGLRIAIGIGSMRTADRQLDIMDGDAIYLSGRALDSIHQSIRGRVKGGAQIAMTADPSGGALSVIVSLIDYVTNSATARQCETVFHRLQTTTDQETADILGVSRSNVSNILNSAGWASIENAVAYFESINFTEHD